MRILLVEDDRMVGAAVLQALKDAAYAVDWAKDGQTAMEAIEVDTYDLALIDLGLPPPEGIEILRHIRARHSALPVIIVTARSAIEDRVAGLDLGADDYVVKPFELQEMLARMRAVLRRQTPAPGPSLSNGAMTLDPATLEVTHGTERCRLTGREFSLMHALMTRPGVILSRSDLERHVYGWNEEVESNAVEFLIHSIRKKLGPVSTRNVRGVGWMVDRTL